MELESLIQEKRRAICEAFAIYEKTRQATAEMYERLAEQRMVFHAHGGESQSEALCAMETQIRELESIARDALLRFTRISDELTHLHRQKFGEWHVTWTGPRF